MCSDFALMELSISLVELSAPAKYLHLNLFLNFLGPHLYHMEVSRLGVESELQLPAYATAMAMPDPGWSLTYTKAHSSATSLTP